MDTRLRGYDEEKTGMTNNKLLCLGIESSCDETAAAIVRGNGDVVAHTIYSQVPEHQKWGGVVPELAARAHILAIDQVVKKTLADANMTIDNIDVIAATAGPGLIGGVIVGWEFATGLAHAAKKPLIAVNHLEGHALVARLPSRDSRIAPLPSSFPRRRESIACKPVISSRKELGSTAVDSRLRGNDGSGISATNRESRIANPSFPYLLLLASGGHSEILIARGVGDYELLGRTLDDSAGEAFDKVAKMLDLGYPGGPAVEKAALTGDPSKFRFPRPLCNQKNSDFSFSGLKTAARTFAAKTPNINKNDLCAGFQAAVVDVITNRLGNAIKMRPDVKTLVAAGGVAANKAIRDALLTLAHEHEMEFVAPPMNLCTDNGIMIAWAGIENYNMGNIATESVAPRPRWPLTAKVPLPCGGGVEQGEAGAGVADADC